MLFSVLSLFAASRYDFIDDTPIGIRCLLYDGSNIDEGEEGGVLILHLSCGDWKAEEGEKIHKMKKNDKRKGLVMS